MVFVVNSTKRGQVNKCQFPKFEFSFIIIFWCSFWQMLIVISFLLIRKKMRYFFYGKGAQWVWNLEILHIRRCTQFTFFELFSLRRQRLGRLSFLSEFISQKLSKVSIWNLAYLFTIKRLTNYNKADDPVICISRVICPFFDIVHRN
jgi:hypothetical protein